MDIKIQSVLIGLVVGWLLSQATEIYKKWYDRKRKIKAIYTELDDLSAWLQRHLLTAKLCIQLAANKKTVTNLPAHLHKFLLDEYFHEVCIYLPRDARLGLTECISQINYLNNINDELAELLKKPSLVDNNDFITKYQSLYSITKETKFKIDFLLSNRDGDLRKLQGAAAKIRSEIQADLANIMKEAKEKSAETIQNAYLSE